jgi:hypothetical protein
MTAQRRDELWTKQTIAMCDAYGFYKTLEIIEQNRKAGVITEERASVSMTAARKYWMKLRAIV